MRQPHKSRISILIRVNRNRADASIFRGPDDSDCNFSPVSNEHFGYTSHDPSLDVFKRPLSLGSRQRWKLGNQEFLLIMVWAQTTLLRERLSVCSGCAGTSAKGPRQPRFRRSVGQCSSPDVGLRSVPLGQGLESLIPSPCSSIAVFPLCWVDSLCAPQPSVCAKRR